MKIVTTHEVDKCRDCPYSTNSSQPHDCAFTSAPHPTTWYCRKANNRIVHDEYKIPKWCPYKEKV
jgi:hypothetical protein